MIRKVFYLAILAPLLTIGEAKKESKLTLINPKFFPSGKYAKSKKFGKCDPLWAIDGDDPSDHMKRFPKGTNLWVWYWKNKAGPCQGAAKGLREDSFRVQIYEAVDGVTKFEAWPGITNNKEAFFKFSQLSVCQNADFTRCTQCQRQVTGKKDFKCARRGRCTSPHYPYVEGGKAPIRFICSSKTKGQYVEVALPPEEARKWGYSNSRWSRKKYVVDLIEITAFGYISPTANPTSNMTCQCENGRGASGKECPSAEAFKCSTCNAGYQLKGDECVNMCTAGYHMKGDKCVKNRCICVGGTADLDCPKNNAVKCTSCNVGFYFQADKSCKASNQECLKRMYAGLSKTNLAIDVKWVNGSILLSKRGYGYSVHKLAKFKDLTIKSYTIETGVKSYRLRATIGWIPINKTCTPLYRKRRWAQWKPGRCTDFKNRGGNKNSGIGRNTIRSWSFEGMQALSYGGRRWDKGRWVVKTSLQRKANGIEPYVTVEFEDGKVENYPKPKVKYSGKKGRAIEDLQWDNLVPAIAIRSTNSPIKVVDAECDQ